jgi:hypothetical protein
VGLGLGEQGAAGAVEGGEAAADLFRLRQAQLAEDGQGLLEAGPGGDGLAEQLIGVAQALPRAG